MAGKPHNDSYHNYLPKLQAIWARNSIESQSYYRMPFILIHSLPPELIFVVSLSSSQRTPRSVKKIFGDFLYESSAEKYFLNHFQGRKQTT